MERSITGYHLDAVRDWVAELSCGHNQHVRHRPPFEERPWVQSAAGRAGRIGTALACPLCDRGELPAGLRLVCTGPEWTEDTMPAGVHGPRRIEGGTWGLIHVHDGLLRFSMAAEPQLEIDLLRGAAQAIPPETDHEIRPLGKVRFSIDYLVVDRGDSAPAPSLADQGGDPACWAGLVCPECGAMLDGSPHRTGCPAVTSN